MDSITIATLALVGVTLWLVFETKGAAKRQLRVQTWLTFIARFDSKEMISARKTLAGLLENYSRSKHARISETVMNFFEDAGIAYAKSCLDRDLASASFSYHANHWWEAVKGYVDEERRLKGDDPSLFEDFEDFAKAMRGRDPKIDSEKLKAFLDDEQRLKLDA